VFLIKFNYGLWQLHIKFFSQLWFSSLEMFKYYQDDSTCLVDFMGAILFVKLFSILFELKITGSLINFLYPPMKIKNIYI
jgi:hypothetical protein